eukprot:COSAG01_NODE_22987_length_833_cov_1.158038_2_plen_26_part_01
MLRLQLVAGQTVDMLLLQSFDTIAVL